MSIDSVFTSLRTCLLSFLPEYEVFRTLVNRVPLPKDNFVLMTPIIFNRISTNETSNTDTEQTEVNDTLFSIQIDVYGLSSYEAALKIMTLFRSDYFFTYGIAPLFSSDIRELTYIDASRQMLQRWSLDLNFYYEPSVTYPMQTANTLEFNIFEQANT